MIAPLLRFGSRPSAFRHAVSTSRASLYTDLPSPTWSIASLQLDQKHEPVTRTELSVLAKRALISLPILDQMERTEQLQQDLGNMIHMIRQVQDFAQQDETPLTDADTYDRPRGVEAIRPMSTERDDREEIEAKQVWESLLKPKTTAVGAHSYFVIATNRKQNIKTK